MMRGFRGYCHFALSLTGVANRIEGCRGNVIRFGSLREDAARLDSID